MREQRYRHLVRRLLSAGALLAVVALAGPAGAQTPTPQAAPTQAAPTVAAPTPSGAVASPPDGVQPKATPAPASPPAVAAPTATPSTEPPKAAPAPAPADKTPGANPSETKPSDTKPSDTKPSDIKPGDTPEGTPLAPSGPPQQNEIEPNGSPGVPDNATTENVDVPSRPIVMVKGQSSYDDAFKSIKASQETVKAAMDKAGLKPSGHPITIFSEPDDKGFKYQAGVPVAQKPDKADFGNGVVVGMSPAGKAIKFQHRGAYDDIDSTYDVITAFLDAKGLQVDSPYIEEYLSDLTTADDPNLQVDIYVFVK